MLGFRLSAQHWPEAKKVREGVISRYDGAPYEVDPDLMQENVEQQYIPEWDFHRIVDHREHHLEWMHEHWADEVISGQELLDEIEAEEV